MRRCGPGGVNQQPDPNTSPDRRSTASRLTQKDGREPEDERRGFHNKSRDLFKKNFYWKPNKPFIDNVTLSVLHMSVHC